MSKKLTVEEAKGLKGYIKKHGGQVAVAVDFNVTPGTLSRTVNRHTGPDPRLRATLADKGIIKKA